MKSPRIAFIGAGNMASAIVAGLVSAGFPTDHICLSNPSPEKLKTLESRYGVMTTNSNVKAAEAADILVLSVKPKVIPTVCQEIASVCHARQPVLVSLASGVFTDSLEKVIGTPLPIILAMPNTPAAVGAGVTGLFANGLVNATQKAHVERLFRSVGLVAWLEKESDIDTIIAVSGSAPAYFFLMMEAIQDVGQKLGLKPDVAELLAAQTALGAAKIAIESSDNVSTLRQRVTSPNGTTLAATEVFEEAGFRRIVEHAMMTAIKRSQEIAEAIRLDIREGV